VGDLVIRGGRVVDPANGIDQVFDVRISDGAIAEVGAGLAGTGEVFDARGLIVAPGLVDVHVHLREPGQEYKETIETGSRAAAAGGFTSVCAMPNTNPVNDNGIITELIRERAERVGLVNVFPIGAITRGSQGDELASIGGMVRAGAVAISDDGQPVMNAQLMRRAMEWAAELGVPVVDHCEDRNLAAGGVVDEGRCSARLGLKGMNRLAEEVQVARDCLLAEATGAHVHIAHLSSARSLDMVRNARARGARVTCEVSPHHYSLTDEAVGEFDTNAKMNPPLRRESDRRALLEGIADGSVDCIATDHAPHHPDEKAQEFDLAPFGIVGLETSLALGLTNLVHTGLISMSRLVELMAAAPARLFGLGRGTVSAGAPADLVCFDPMAEWTVDRARFVSKGRNSPFAGMKLRGLVIKTFKGGRCTYDLRTWACSSAPDEKN
jgi:dihydroorotase